MAITISYPTSASGIIILLKTPKELQYLSSPADFVDTYQLLYLWSMVYELIKKRAHSSNVVEIDVDSIWLHVSLTCLRWMLFPVHKGIPCTWTPALLWPVKLKCCATGKPGVLLRRLRGYSPKLLLRLRNRQK